MAPALETKFLLFDVGQEQDSALSLPPRLALGLTRLSLPASSSAALPHLRSVERPPVRGQVARRRRRTDVPLRDMRPRHVQVQGNASEVPERAILLRGDAFPRAGWG